MSAPKSLGGLGMRLYRIVVTLPYDSVAAMGVLLQVLSELIYVCESPL